MPKMKNENKMQHGVGKIRTYGGMDTNRGARIAPEQGQRANGEHGNEPKANGPKIREEEYERPVARAQDRQRLAPPPARIA